MAQSGVVKMGYLHTFLKPKHAYYEAWREYRRRRTLMWLASLGWIPMGLIGVFLAGLLSLLLGPGGAVGALPIVAVPLVAITFATLLVAYWRFRMWPCPRCRRAFRNPRYWPLSDRCPHCGLDLYAPCDPADQKWEYEDLVHASRSRRNPERRRIS